MNEQKRHSAVIIGASLVLSAFVFGGFYYSAQSANTKDSLSVTGSTKTRVTSDQAKLSIVLSRIVFSTELGVGYTGVARDLALTENMLKKYGIATSDITEGPVSMNQVYDQTNSGQIRYQLNQTVTVQSNDIQKITELSKRVPDLASQGAVVSIQSLEYFYSKLPDLRVSLLTDAVMDAKARAEKIALGTGRSIGAVQSASSGVVQVLSPNSVDISDYGNYDTTSIEKDVMITVKASFRLK